MMSSISANLLKKGVISGSDTQFSIANQETCDLVIGLDLGTSCTKVVVQSPYRHSGWSHAIPLGLHVKEIYLIPTQLFYDVLSGKTDIVEFPQAKRFQNLKLRFIDKPNQIVCNLADGHSVCIRDFSICIIANILLKTREWIFANCSDMFRQYKIIWHLNMGIPSSNFQKKYFNLYRAIALAGWNLSTSSNGITLQNASLCHLDECTNSNSSIHPDLVNIIPEVTAEVVNYARSESRNSGLHVIIDVGASTLDVAGFELYERTGKDNYSLIETRVRRLGAYRCHLARLKAMRRRILQGYAVDELFSDPSYRVNQRLEEYLPKIDLVDFNQNFQFYRKVRQCIGNVIKSLHNESDPLAKAWETGLPIFLCGGGQFVDLYQSVLNDIKADWQKNSRRINFKITRLDQKPANFHGDGVEFHRLAVAHGLSFPKEEFGDIWPKPKKRVIEINKNVDDYEHHFIRKEDT
ncbi:MAG TPA: hypothetical protein PK843_05750 [bacterium]|nr:hypothetical protein [bacterium]